ncbi:hypothetical protein [Ancylobacter pratisalsi]|uniref:Uncharacterized protein n=1 Tax=Ancylobacter pratisalsi TaxID=1745854 RepID=A0A6P1YUF5_9HYPH|nr:hypothetical protein [Ancylobacter pratisalsi]QIB35703.1 hypothetical protein G3A50_19815 [Ancylobacter pratisalsi]
MARRSFHPGPHTTLFIVLLGGFALGWAIYMRYALVEQSSVGLACIGVETATCHTRALVIWLFGYSAFGITALVASIIQFIRPRVPIFVIGAMASAAGVVLYNNNLAALAAGILLISLDRPWRRAKA